MAGYQSLNEYIALRHIVVHALTDGERYRGRGETMQASDPLKNVGVTVG